MGSTRPFIRVRARWARPHRGRRAGIWIAAIAVVATSCGLPRVPPRATTPADPAATSVSTSPSPSRTYPHEAEFASPIERLIYRIAFDRCAVAGIQGAARDYGGDESDPDSIATAYARSADPDHVQPAFTGCLDGLRTDTP